MAKKKVAKKAAVSDQEPEKKDDGLGLDDIMGKLMDAPAELKKAFYEHGRQESVKSKGAQSKVWYSLNRSNVVLGALMIGGIFLGSMWVWTNILQPLGRRFGIIEQRMHNGFVQIPEKFEIFKGDKPTRDTVSKLEIEIPVKGEDGSIVKKKVQVFADGKGHMYAKKKDFSNHKMTVVPMISTFDWHLQPGLGFIVVPSAEEEEELFDPAFFVSPLEIYNKVSLDAFVTPRRIGGGISGKLPFNWTKNTYLGGGIAVPYDDVVQKEFVVYGRINF